MMPLAFRNIKDFFANFEKIEKNDIFHNIFEHSKFIWTDIAGGSFSFKLEAKMHKKCVA